jgi:hypothetical protein
MDVQIGRLLLSYLSFFTASWFAWDRSILVKRTNMSIPITMAISPHQLRSRKSLAI